MYSNYLRFCISFTLITYGASLLCWECAQTDFHDDLNCIDNFLTNCSDPFISSTEATPPGESVPDNSKSKAKNTSEEDFGLRQHVCYIVFGDVILLDNGTNIDEAPTDHEEEYLEDLEDGKSGPFNYKDCWKLDKFKKLRSGEYALKNLSLDQNEDFIEPIIIGTGVRRGCYKRTKDIRNDTDVCNCVRYQLSLEHPRCLDVKICFICQQDRCVEPPGYIPIEPPREGVQAISATIPLTISLYLVFINFSLLCF